MWKGGGVRQYFILNPTDHRRKVYSVYVLGRDISAIQRTDQTVGQDRSPGGGGGGGGGVRVMLGEIRAVRTPIRDVCRVYMAK